MTLRDNLHDHIGTFFTNWQNPTYGFADKVRLMFTNRAKSLVNGGCCGNHGQPGC